MTPLEAYALAVLEGKRHISVWWDDDAMPCKALPVRRHVLCNHDTLGVYYLPPLCRWCGQAPAPHARTKEVFAT